jgi:hypothetical protein
MVPRVGESIDSQVHLRLSDVGGAIIFEGQSGHAGMEIEGDTSILVTGS